MLEGFLRFVTLKQRKAAVSSLIVCFGFMQDIAPSKHVTLEAIKGLIAKVQREREVILFLDLHAHSRRKNVFAYGCMNKDRPGLEKQFPRLLGQACKAFKYRCVDTFGV